VGGDQRPLRKSPLAYLSGRFICIAKFAAMLGMDLNLHFHKMGGLDQPRQYACPCPEVVLSKPQP
jgi:hypothetical protein